MRPLNHRIAAAFSVRPALTTAARYSQRGLLQVNELLLSVTVALMRLVLLAETSFDCDFESVILNVLFARLR